VTWELSATCAPSKIEAALVEARDAQLELASFDAWPADVETQMAAGIASAAAAGEGIRARKVQVNIIGHPKGDGQEVDAISVGLYGVAPAKRKS
jgi:hypothetical protein